MNFHPLANIFPLLEGEAFERLVADVAAHGVREPIWLHEQMILDGRNRWRAAQEAGVDCPAREYEGADALGLVLSLNLERRHLSSGQLALLALEIERIEAERARERQLATLRRGDAVPANLREREDVGEAAEKAAAAVGVSARQVQKAKKLAQERPDLAEGSMRCAGSARCCKRRRRRLARKASGRKARYQTGTALSPTSASTRRHPRSPRNLRRFHRSGSIRCARAPMQA